MNTAAIKAAMRTKYGTQEWALMFEVRDAAGFDGKRSADAIAMNLWPSRGLAVLGFEFKASKTDWKRELANPAKAEAIQKFCDYWWIVALPNVVDRADLPPTWGLQELVNNKLSVKVEAPKLQALPLSRGFIACLLRRSTEFDGDMIKKLVDKQVEEIRKTDESRVECEIQRRTKRAEELVQKLDMIKEATGINLESWSPGTEEICKALKALLSGNLLSNYGGIRSMANDLGVLHGKLRVLADALAPKESVDAQ